MRTREAIESEREHAQDKYRKAETCALHQQALILEVLLDIRDLLQNPPIEITGEPMKITPQE